MLVQHSREAPNQSFFPVTDYRSTIYCLFQYNSISANQESPYIVVVPKKHPDTSTLRVIITCFQDPSPSPLNNAIFENVKNANLKLKLTNEMKKDLDFCLMWKEEFPPKSGSKRFNTIASNSPKKAAKTTDTSKTSSKQVRFNVNKTNETEILELSSDEDSDIAGDTKISTKKENSQSSNELLDNTCNNETSEEESNEMTLEKPSSSDLKTNNAIKNEPSDVPGIGSVMLDTDEKDITIETTTTTGGGNKSDEEDRNSDHNNSNNNRNNNSNSNNGNNNNNNNNNSNSNNNSDDSNEFKSKLSDVDQIEPAQLIVLLDKLDKNSKIYDFEYDKNLKDVDVKKIFDENLLVPGSIIEGFDNDYLQGTSMDGVENDLADSRLIVCLCF